MQARAEGEHSKAPTHLIGQPLQRRAQRCQTRHLRPRKLQQAAPHLRFSTSRSRLMGADAMDDSRLPCSRLPSRLISRA